MRYEITVIDTDRFTNASYRVAPWVRQEVRAVTSTSAAADAWIAAHRERAYQQGHTVSTTAVREVDAALVHVEPSLIHLDHEHLDAASLSGWTAWAYWTDDSITSAQLIEERPRVFGVAAVRLINLVRGGHGADPDEGWSLLTRVAEVRAREEVASTQGRGGYSRDSVQRLRVVMVDGQERDLWMRKRDHDRGFQCSIHGERPAAWRLNRRGVLEPWGG